MRSTKNSDKLGFLVVLVLLIGASFVALKYVGYISADIVKKAETSPLSETDFSLENNFSDTSWVAFSNLGDETPKISDGTLKIANTKTKYSTILAQPIILSSGTKYNISISYQAKAKSSDFSVRYGLVQNNLISKPIFVSNLDAAKKDIHFEYEPLENSPFSFEYFRVLGEGSFSLASIKIEKLDKATEKTVVSASPTNTIKTEETTTPQIAASPAGESGEPYMVSVGWSAFGSDKTISSESFTKFGLSVYSASEEGWKIAKSSNSNSDFDITANTGVYLLNESDDPINVTLRQVESGTKPELKQGWNLYYSDKESNLSEVIFENDNKQISLADLLKDGKVSKNIYEVGLGEVAQMSKLNLEKIQNLGSKKIVWIYLF